MARERTPSWQKEVCFGVSEVHHKMRRLGTLSYHTGEVDSHTTHQRDEAIISVKDFNGSVHSANGLGGILTHGHAISGVGMSTEEGASC